MVNVKTAVGILFPVLLTLFVACEDDEKKTVAGLTGGPPAIIRLSCDTSEVAVGGYTSVHCEAYDPDHDSLAYSWIALYGTFPEGNRSATVRWVAPSSPYNVILTCTVTDYMYSVSMSLGINVVFKP